MKLGWLSFLFVPMLAVGCATPETKMVACSPGYDCPATAPSPWTRALVDRGARDLQCAPQQVDVIANGVSDYGTYEVRGCGMHVMYVRGYSSGLQRTSFVEPLGNELHAERNVQ